MDWFDRLAAPTPEQAGLAALIAMVAAGIFAGWARVFGKKEGPPQPKVQEFYTSGSLSDMGPVKELVAQTGLLVQQQVRTNMALERLALAAESAIKRHAEEVKDQDIREEIDRESDRKARILAEDIVRRREEADAERRPTRKST